MLPKIRSSTKQKDWVHLHFNIRPRVSNCQNLKSHSETLSLRFHCKTVRLIYFPTRQIVRALIHSVLTILVKQHLLLLPRWQNNTFEYIHSLHLWCMLHIRKHSLNNFIICYSAFWTDRKDPQSLQCSVSRSVVILT